MHKMLKMTGRAGALLLWAALVVGCGTSGQKKPDAKLTEQPVPDEQLARQGDAAQPDPNAKAADPNAADPNAAKTADPNAKPDDRAQPKDATADPKAGDPKAADPNAAASTKPADPNAADPNAAKTADPPKGDDPKAADPKAGDPTQIDYAVTTKIKQAMEQLGSGNADGAAATLQQVVDNPRGGYLAAYNLGVLRERQGKDADALSFYTKALQLNPDFSPALTNIARIYAREGRLGDAQAFVKKYVDARPANLNHRVVRVELLLREGKNRDADTECKEILRTDQRNLGAMLAMAQANYNLERYELAKTILLRARDYAPTMADIPHKLGLIFLKTDKPLVAKEQFKKAIELRPAFPEAHNNLGLIYHQARDFQNAATEFQAAVRDWPRFKEAHLNLGNAYKGLQKYREAEAAFKQATTVDPEYADAHFNLGILYLDSPVPGMDKIDRYQKAIDALNTYKAKARGRIGKDDPADKFIAEAAKKKKDEQTLREMQREAAKQNAPKS